MSRLDLIVPDGLEGQRVDRALALVSGLSRSAVLERVAAGAVSVDGKVVAKGSTPLRAGQRLEVDLGPEPATAVAPDDRVVVTVVVEDEEFLVVEKAPGQVVHPGAGQREGTLIAGILARFPEVAELTESAGCDPWRPGVVHRLDKGTSGLLVVARTERAWRSLSEQMAERAVTREYVGLAEGHLAEARGVIDAPLGRSTSRPTLMAVRPDGRPARTHYEVRARLENPRRTLLALRLETGRTHQIRVHLASIGHPVVNDSRYGRRREPRLEPERVFLHAKRLAFVHPRTGERVLVESALPADLAALLPEGADS